MLDEPRMPASPRHALEQLQRPIGSLKRAWMLRMWPCSPERSQNSEAQGSR
jgi:CHASE1-domain containing sensor protein